jgi:signal transduction histidine kinase
MHPPPEGPVGHAPGVSAWGANRRWLERALCALPWLAAVVYLGFIMNLGAAFQGIADYRIDELTARSADGETEIQPLGFSRLVEDVRETRLQRFELRLSAADLAESEAAQQAPAGRPTGLALFIPRMTASATIALDGRTLFRPPSAWEARYTYQPQLVELPDAPAPSGREHVLTIDLRAGGPAMTLSVIYLGPREALQPAWQQFRFFRESLLHGALAITVLIALFLGTIWRARRRFAEYGWLALAFASFSVYLGSFVRTTVPADYALYNWTFLAAQALFVWAMVCFVHRFLGLRRRVMERVLASMFVGVFGIGLVLVLADRYDLFLSIVSMTSMSMALFAVGYLAVVLARATLQAREAHLHWLLVGAVVGLILGLHDVLVLFDVQHRLVLDFYISHYGILFIVVGYGGVLVHRVARALLTSEDLNVELNRQLDHRQRELEQAARRRMAQDRELARHAERQRIMGDMHDGVGGQLVGLLAAHRQRQIRPEQVEAALEQIVADLRIVLDALSPAGEDLVLALARLRERYQPLLTGAGITPRWWIDPAIADFPLPPGQTVQCLRFVQEAVQNALKHARAGTIDVRLEQEAAGARLSVRDDGVGLPSEPTPGYGSRSLEERAIALGSRLERRSTPGAGTVLSILIAPDEAAERTE